MVNEWSCTVVMRGQGLASEGRGFAAISGCANGRGESRCGLHSDPMQEIRRFLVAGWNAGGFLFTSRRCNRLVPKDLQQRRQRGIAPEVFSPQIPYAVVN